MEPKDLPLKYVYRACDGYGCTKAEALALWELGVPVVSIGLWRGMARRVDSLIRFLEAGHRVSAVFAVAKIFQRATPDDDDIMAALSMGMTAAQAEAFDEAMPKYDRTLADVVVFLNPDLPADYAASLV